MTSKHRFAPVALATSMSLSLLFAASASAQTTATTDPVGFMTITVLAGKTQAVSIPLKDQPAFAGAITSFTGTTITTLNAGFASYGPFATNPCIVRFKTGANAGRHFKIASNTTDTLTLTTPGSNFASIMHPGDTYEIVVVDTLGSLFGNNASGANFLTGADSASADNILIRGSTGWLTYWNDGTNWRRDGAGITVQNNFALLPESGLLFIRRDTTSNLTFTVTGVVPTTALITDLPGGKTTFLSNAFPTNMTLTTITGGTKGLDLDTDPNWTKGGDSSLVDNILVRGSTGWLTYYHDGSSWHRDGTTAGNQNPSLAAGTSVLIIRRGSGNIALNRVLPYSL